MDFHGIFLDVSCPRLNEAMLLEELHLVVHPAALGAHRQHHRLGRRRPGGGHGVAEAETGAAWDRGATGTVGDFGRGFTWEEWGNIMKHHETYSIPWESKTRQSIVARRGLNFGVGDRTLPLSAAHTEGSITILISSNSSYHGMSYHDKVCHVSLKNLRVIVISS